MIEYAYCKWCTARIWQDDEDPGWIHRGHQGRFCQATVATPPDNHGRCSECNAENWRTCGCTSIVAYQGRTIAQQGTDAVRLINEEKQSGR